MDSVAQLEKDLREATKELVVDCLALLAKQGIHVGARVTKDGVTYLISSIQAAMGGRKCTGAYLQVFGHKFLRDKSWGTHEHYLGQPHELRPVPL